MEIFLTGASGFIGAPVLRHLLARVGYGGKIHALVRRPGELPVDPRLVELPGSLEKIEEQAAALRGADHVVHLAANAVYGSRDDYDAVNLEPTRKMLEILRGSSRLKSFIFTSTIGAVDRSRGDRCRSPLGAESRPSPRSAYGRSKLRAEEAIRGSGLPFTIIRPSWVYGENMRAASHVNQFVTMAARASPIQRLDFPGRVSLIHVEDLARAIAASLENPRAIGKTYFAETEHRSIGEIFRAIGARLGRPPASRIRIPSFRALVAPLHPILPLALSNLFIDYLRAEDPAFRADLGIDSWRSFEEGVDDVIRTNAESCGRWVITGANSGIGLELARKLKARGKRLILIDRDLDRLGEFDGEIRLQADLSKDEELKELAVKIRPHLIGALVNNAGIGFRRPFDEMSLEEIHATIAVNSLAPMVLTRLLLDRLKKHRSVIVNLASSIAYNPLPFMALYSASKACLSNWSESLAYELRETNRVITVSPSGTLTGFQARAGVKVLRGGKGLLSPGEVAERILKTVRGKRRVAIYGLRTRVLLLVSRLLPREMNIRFWGRLMRSLR